MPKEYAARSLAKQLAQRRGEYGIDAPYVPLILGLIGASFLAIGFFSVWRFNALIFGIIFLAYGLFLLLSTASYIYTTRLGKFRAWAEMLIQLELQGDEQVIDMGCGRGAVLLMAASLLPRGKVMGVDLWKSSDQSGNAISVTQRNAELEGVAERIELCTADMQKLPFADDTFDIALSSLAIHNIPDVAGRTQAINEAVRVIKPGGRIIIADFRETSRYAEHLRDLGLTEVTHRALDWRFWYGGPWGATKVVSARKPVA